MIKVLTRKEFKNVCEQSERWKHEADELRIQLDSASSTQSRLSMELLDLENALAEARESEAKAREELADLKKELNRAVERSTIDPNKNSVSIQISDDFQTITPVVKYKKESAESMVHLGMISDSEYESEFPVQIALMTIAHDGLAQILESFEAAKDDGE